MNVEIEAEDALFPKKEYTNRIAVAVNVWGGIAYSNVCILREA
jgi:hypothetical protein